MAEPATKLSTSSLAANWKCLLICCVVSMANFEYGLDSGIVGSLQAMPGFLGVFGYANPHIPGGYGLDSTFQQLITSFPILGALLSSAFAGIFSIHLGRKPGLWVACFFTAVGVALQMGTENWAAIYIGRLVLGIGNGFLTTFSNIYCAEAAPSHLRPIMVGLTTEWILIGSIVAAAITNATNSRLDKFSYQLPLGILLIMPVLLSIALFWVPESPRYLLFRSSSSSSSKEARSALLALRGTAQTESETDLEFTEMANGIAHEKALASSVSPLDMFRSTDRRRTLLSFAVNITDSGGSGAWFLIPYATYFMVISGIPFEKVFHYFLINTCLGLVGCNLGLFLMRHVCGRRTFLLVSAAGNAAFMLALAVGSTQSQDIETRKTLIVVFVSLFLIWYSFGTGVASRPVATELVSTRLRAWSFGAGQASGHLVVWLVSFCTPYFINPEKMNWGGKYAYIFFGSSVASFLWYYFFLPETKGRTLEEIDELFENKVATWDFPTYQTKILEKALEDVRNQQLEDNDSTTNKRDSKSDSKSGEGSD